MTWAWQQDVDPAEKLVLLALANRTNHETGMCFPGQRLIADECSMSDRTVRRHLKSLEDRGLISRRARMRTEGRGRTSDEYRLAYVQADMLAAKSPAGRDRTTNRTNQDDQPDNGVQGRTEREPKEEPLAARPPETVRRQPDRLFDAVCTACEIAPGDLTRSGRGALNRSVKELREAGATPDAVATRAAAYRKAYPNAACTPSALAKHWASLTPEAKPKRRSAWDTYEPQEYY